MLVLSSRRSEDSLEWKELRIKFALFPRILESGKIAWLRTYQELFYIYRFKPIPWRSYYDKKEVLIRRNIQLTNAVEEFKQVDIKQIKKTLDALE